MMRNVTLSLVIFLLCYGVTSFSQGTCGTAPTATLNGSCQAIVPVVQTTGTTSPVCSYPTGNTGRAYAWVKFHPSSSTACVTFNVSNNSTTTIRTEVGLYTGNCAGTLTAQTAQGLCLADGLGVWSPVPGYTWPSWTSNSAATSGYWYYLRIYTADDIVTAIPGTIPENITVCGTETTPSNDQCSGATKIDGVLITDNNVCNKGGSTETELYNGGVSNGTSSTPNAGWICAQILHNTAWYQFKIENGAIATILNISGLNCDQRSGAAGEVQVGLMTGTCGTTTSLKKESSSQTGSPNCYQGSSPSSLTIPAGRYPTGTTIYVAVDGRNGSNCQFSATVTNAIPIPVKLKYFLVFKNTSSNMVRWVSSNEQNNDYYEIERSTDGITFQSIGQVKGAGNSSDEINYIFEDNNPPALAYYRLKQVDFDTRADYSNVVMVRRDIRSTTFDVSFVNPVQNSGWINIVAEKRGAVNLQIVDVSGKSLSTRVIECGHGGNTVLQDYSKLPAGTYYLVVLQDGERIVKPFVKQ